MSWLHMTNTSEAATGKCVTFYSYYKRKKKSYLAVLLLIIHLVSSDTQYPASNEGEGVRMWGVTSISICFCMSWGSIQCDAKDGGLPEGGQGRVETWRTSAVIQCRPHMNNPSSGVWRKLHFHKYFSLVILNSAFNLLTTEFNQFKELSLPATQLWIWNLEPCINMFTAFPLRVNRYVHDNVYILLNNDPSKSSSCTYCVVYYHQGHCSSQSAALY